LRSPTLAAAELRQRLKLLILLRAFERSGVAFSLVPFFWRSKRKELAKGESFSKHASGKLEK